MTSKELAEIDGFKPQKLVACMVFLRKPCGGQFEREGLGVHPFGRIPVPGEYVALDDGSDCFYTVRHVVHTGFGSHSAELFVERDPSTRSEFGDPFPPL